MGIKRLTIQDAVEEFDLFDLYNEVIESFADELEDPSLVSDLYDLIDEYEEEFEFTKDSEGDLSASFERNLRDAIMTIVEETEALAFVDDEFDDDEIPELYEDDYESDSEEYDDVDLEEDEDSYDY